jgi:hypothetical protein
VSTALWIALGIVLLACYVTWTAARLDRLHAGVDARWAALDAQLVRRAAAAKELVPLLPEGPERTQLTTSAAAAIGAEQLGREAIENDLTRALRSAVPLLPSTPDATQAMADLEAAVTRVGLGRSFYNSAVQGTRTVRRRRLPRALRLAGHRALPTYFDVDDTALV